MKTPLLFSANIRCTGARQIATGLNELARRDGKVRFLLLDIRCILKSFVHVLYLRFLSLQCALDRVWAQRASLLDNDGLGFFSTPRWFL